MARQTEQSAHNTIRRRARRAVGEAPARIDGDALDLLYAAADVVIIPHLAEDGEPIILGPLTGRGLVVAGAAAADVRQLSELGPDGPLDVGHGVPRRVRGIDPARREPPPRRQVLVVRDHGAEEVYHLLVTRVRRPVALHVEGAVARRVLAEFVRPEVPAWLV